MNNNSNNNIVLNTVKSWVDLDNEIREEQNKINLLKQEKKRISKALLELMKSSNTDCYNTKGCQLILKVKNTKKSINKKNLLSMLNTFYVDDPAKAEEMNDYLQNNRENIISESIIRKNVD